MPKLKISEEVARQNVEKLNGLLTEYDQHIRNAALKTLRNICYTNIKKLLSISKDHEDIQRKVKSFEKQATTILNDTLFDFEAAIEALNHEAQSLQLDKLDMVIFLNNDLLIIKQKQDGIKDLQGTLRENGKLASARLEDFVQVYQDNNTFHNPLQNPKTPVLFARRRHQDGILHKQLMQFLLN